MKPLTKELTTRLLNIFREKEERETLRHFMPIEFYGKKWIVKTTSYHFIMVPENEENRVDALTEKVVNFAGILPDLDLPIDFPFEVLRSVYDSIPIVEVKATTECESCEGEGEFDHYGYTYECNACNGDGFIWNGKHELVKEPDAKLEILNSNFKTFGIKDLLDVVAYADCHRIQIRYSCGKLIFELDDSIMVGIMSCMPTKGDKLYRVI